MPKRKNETQDAYLARRRAYHAAHQEEEAAYRKAYNESHREENAARKLAYNAARREENAAYSRAYNAAHREKVAAKDAAYYAAHRDEKSARDKVRRKENRAKIAEKEREYHAAHPGKRAEWKRAWDVAHPEKVRAARQARQSRLESNGGTHTAAEWRALCDWFGNVCLCCGAGDKLSEDHVIPVVKGGSDSISNLQPLCIPCNDKKHRKTIDYRDPVRLTEFLESQMKGGE